MKKLSSLLFACVIISSVALSQAAKTAPAKTAGPFEGTIDFMQSNGNDTSLYKYYVKQTREPGYNKYNVQGQYVFYHLESRG